MVMAIMTAAGQLRYAPIDLAGVVVRYRARNQVRAVRFNLDEITTLMVGAGQKHLIAHDDRRAMAPAGNGGLPAQISPAQR